MPQEDTDLLPSVVGDYDDDSPLPETAQDEVILLSPRERWRKLVQDYGLLPAIPRFFFKGENNTDDHLREREPKLPWTTNILIYVISFAALIVSGSVEMIAIAHGFALHDPIEIVIPFAMLGTLFLMVVAMDKALARTIPRIALLAQRREWVVLVESVFYGAAVGGIEITTLTILILNESRVSAILHGVPLVAAGTFAYTAMAVSRAAITFWTIIHSHLVNEPLPIQLSTAKREAAEIFGGQFIERVRLLKRKKGIALGRLLETFLLFMQPVPRAPKSGEDVAEYDKKGNLIRTAKYNRMREQARLLQEHHGELVRVLNDLEQLPEVPTPPATKRTDMGTAQGVPGNPGGERDGAANLLLGVTVNGSKTGGSQIVSNGDQVPSPSGANGNFDPNGQDNEHTSPRSGDQVPASTTPSGTHDPDENENGRPLLPFPATGKLGPSDLEKRYDIPAGYTLTSRLKQSQVQQVFGVAAETLRRKAEDFAAQGLSPFYDDGAKVYEVWQILWLYEQGAFMGSARASETIGAMVLEAA